MRADRLERPVYGNATSLCFDDYARRRVADESPRLERLCEVVNERAKPTLHNAADKYAPSTRIERMQDASTYAGCCETYTTPSQYRE